jgi:hypothetical protein
MTPHLLTPTTTFFEDLGMGKTLMNLCLLGLLTVARYGSERKLSAHGRHCLSWPSVPFDFAMLRGSVFIIYSS